jgi:hypothetical protein
MAISAPSFSVGPVRTLLSAIFLAQWISGVVSLGLVVYFIHALGRGTHETYEVIIVRQHFKALSFEIEIEY